LKLDATKQKQKTTNRRDEGGRHAIHHLYSPPHLTKKQKHTHYKNRYDTTHNTLLYS
jgi:hypothetical protein